jgi:hypothetical protein
LSAGNDHEIIPIEQPPLGGFGGEQMRKRRSLERFDLKLPVIIEVLGDAEKKTIELETSNISSDGAYFPTRRPLKRGEKVKIRMVLPAARRKKEKPFRHALVEVEGVVNRSEPRGMAIAFQDYKMTSLGV